jgi:hypothetical protein
MCNTTTRFEWAGDRGAPGVRADFYERRSLMHCLESGWEFSGTDVLTVLSPSTPLPSPTVMVALMHNTISHGR